MLWVSLPGKPQDTNLVQKLLHEKTLEGASWSVMVRRCSDGQVLLAHNEKLRLLPASVQKILISFAALELLGPSHTFFSDFYLQEHFSGNGVWEGALVVDVRQNPAFGTPGLTSPSVDSLTALLTAEFKNRGAQRVALQVVPLLRRHTMSLLPEAWYVEDLAFRYGTPPQPFVYKENQAELKITWNGDQPLPVFNGRERTPEWLKTDILVDRSARRGGQWEGSLQWQNGRLYWRLALRIKPGDTAVFQIPNPRPECAFFEDLASGIEQRLGIGQFEGELHYETDPFALQAPWLRMESLSLDRLDSVINHQSHNFYSEMLLWNLFDTETDYDGKLEALKKFWEERVGPGLRLRDASGLSRSNWMTADWMTRCLMYIYSSPLFPAFYLTLPQWGLSGTLKNLGNPKDAARGCARAKSGSMQGVQGYAGFLNTARHGTLCFAFFFNHFSGPASDIQKLCTRLLNEFCKP
ncbi:MAG: D-alanyl-D-alanine carboxypeptidase [Flavobacteriales bacterium]|nr:D-alanyl-D-alanine carboxypeptidase [Flavobacteriales bacterium]MCX7650148.1 D-alanyl-D-alanine carboxypeptidase [Flavobacteriales bacterium]MDW8432860.1 D-alanyl-D-alanine carboxypeptidase [Flavobacteriales bacterium]